MVFHLAIPSRNLEESKNFYLTNGAFLGREYRSHVVLNFWGVQLVLHESELFDKEPRMYPRHFGIILSRDAFEELWVLTATKKPEIFEPYFIRHEGKFEEHYTFFLKDPSNNVIEFKSYKNDRAVFGRGFHDNHV